MRVKFPMKFTNWTFAKFHNNEKIFLVNRFSSLECIFKKIEKFRILFVFWLPYYYMSEQKILENILHTDNHIRYATIFDLQGNEIRRLVQKDLELILDEEDTKNTLKYSAKAWMTRRTFEPKIGRCQYVLAIYEKLRRVTMPIGDNHLLMVTWGPDGGTADILEKIGNMLSGDPTRYW